MREIWQTNPLEKKKILTKTKSFIKQLSMHVVNLIS